MSWDVSIIKFSKTYTSLEEIPDDEKPIALGSQKSVHEAVSEYFPSTDWSDPSWGIFDSEFGSIEFNLGDDDPSSDMMLHARASNAVVPLILALCKGQDWLAVDCSTGEFLEFTEDPNAGIEGWRAYRDQMFKKQT